MTRTRQWTKFGVLVAVTLVLALLFAAAIDIPERGQAQQRSVTALAALTTNQPAPLQGPSAAADWSNAFAAVAEAVRPAVVYIRAEVTGTTRGNPHRRLVPSPFDDFFDQPDQPQRRRGEGTGFIISRDGYIMTNNHVVENASKLLVRLFDRREFSAKVVGRDPDTDVAIIKIEGQNFPAVSFGVSDSVRVGEWVLAIGNPLGEEFSFTVTAGIISAKGRGLAGLNTATYNIQDYIQTDAAINPGNSGGPLVNARGQVIGINAAIASQTGYYQGYGFAIPIDLARSVGRQLISEGKVTRAVLGISIQAVTPEDAAYVGLDTIRGVVVEDYTPNMDSPAKRAGIQPGDVIVALDGRAVQYPAQLQQAVRFKKPGDEVEVTVQRKGGERKTFRVRLAATTTEDKMAANVDDVRGGRTAKPFEERIGISVDPISEREAAQDENIGVEHAGLLVSSVDPDGPAADKLLPRSAIGADIITHINEERVKTLADLSAALRSVKPGDIVSFRVWSMRGEGASGSRVVRLRAAGK
ncbi:MAG: trypsin-like peptidase domain-containing protein [Gemmatimonadetes bacterium]|nr:trypsin-like peptidase domain-containing protein [Gemmatimonadota bacterium]